MAKPIIETLEMNKINKYMNRLHFLNHLIHSDLLYIYDEAFYKRNMKKSGQTDRHEQITKVLNEQLFYYPCEIIEFNFGRIILLDIFAPSSSQQTQTTCFKLQDCTTA